MSYPVHIWEEPVPTTVEEADEIMRRFDSHSLDGSINPKYVEAARRIMARYPYNDDRTADVEGEIWSDGPLIPQDSSEPWGVGLLSQYVKEARPFLIATCNELGLVVYDWPEGKVYPPNGRVLSIAKPAATRNKPNRKLAMLVLFLMGASSFVFLVLGIWATFEIWQLIATGNATMPQDGQLFVAAAIVFLIAAAPFFLSWVAMRLAKKAFIQINKNPQSDYD